MSNMQDWLLQIMQLIQYPHVSSFSTVINNEFIGEGVYLSQHSMDGYEAMGFDVTQLTQDVEQSLYYKRFKCRWCRCRCRCWRVP